mmetsp:Transcript_1021/g.2657  ORF Transcript_1021/g.2657 Transcript_1021/m.2657 type:complete len:208 (-) Transcript_1021:1591-2214(-)
MTRRSCRPSTCPSLWCWASFPRRRSSRRRCRPPSGRSSCRRSWRCPTRSTASSGCPRSAPSASSPTKSTVRSPASSRSSSASAHSTRPSPTSASSRRPTTASPAPRPPSASSQSRVCFHLRRWRASRSRSRSPTSCGRPSRTWATSSAPPTGCGRPSSRARVPPCTRRAPRWSPSWASSASPSTAGRTRSRWPRASARRPSRPPAHS